MVHYHYGNFMIFIHFTGGQYLIAGGYDPDDDARMTEVVELINTNSTPSFGQLSYWQWNSIGTMFGNAPTLCGGFNGTSSLDSCLSFKNSQWSQIDMKMNKKRASAAGVQINSTTLWILGGYDEYVDPSYNSSTVYFDSTEFIMEGRTNGVPGPKLPHKLEGMCAVKLSEEEIFVIGGYDENYVYRKEVWIYNPQNGFARYQGYNLNSRRAFHSCSTMRVGEKKVIVVAGGTNKEPDPITHHWPSLDSVEIFDPTDKIWHSGM